MPTIQPEIINNVCSAGLSCLLDGDKTTYLEQKDILETIQHQGKIYWYHGVSDGRAYYSTKRPDQDYMTRKYRSKGIYKILPENHWREVWHDAPCRGPMILDSTQAITIKGDGTPIPLWTCTSCGTKMYAGLDSNRNVRVEPFEG